MHKNVNDGLLQMREAALADIGELSGPVVHEVNNLLNTLTLHLAIWQQSSPQGLDNELQSIRQMIAHVVQLLTRFQRLRLPSGVEPVVMDVNNVITDTVDVVRASAPDSQISVELDPAHLWIRGHEADVRRLCRYLLGNAVRAVSPQGPPVLVRSNKVDHQVVIEVEDAGPSIPPEALNDLFDPGHEQRPGMCCLELAACMSIAHRLRGKVEARAPASAGLIISVRVPLEETQHLSSSGPRRRSRNS